MNNLRKPSVETIETAIVTFMRHGGAYFGELESHQLAGLLRELLARREAAEKPIGSFHIVDQDVEATTDYVKRGEWPIDNGEILVYAAPPLPAVPGEMTREQRDILIKTAKVMFDREPTSDYSANIREVARIALASLNPDEPTDDERIMAIEGIIPVPTVSLDDLLHMAASAIEDLLEHTDPNTSYYSGVWADVPGKLRAAAANSPVIPDGWALVPIEPTEEMNKAGWRAMNESDAINPTWAAMLAAAPKPPATENK